MDQEFHNFVIYFIAVSRVRYTFTRRHVPIMLDPSGGLAGNENYDFNLLYNTYRLLRF